MNISTFTKWHSAESIIQMSRSMGNGSSGRLRTVKRIVIVLIIKAFYHCSLSNMGRCAPT